MNFNSYETLNDQIERKKKVVSRIEKKTTQNKFSEAKESDT